MKRRRVGQGGTFGGDCCLLEKAGQPGLPGKWGRLYRRGGVGRTSEGGSNPDDQQYACVTQGMPEWEPFVRRRRGMLHSRRGQGGVVGQCSGHPGAKWW